MSVHAPKVQSTKAGLGLPNTTKVMKYLDDGTAILTETWSDMPNGAWHEGDVTIAEPGYTWVSKWQAGKPYTLTKFYNREGELVGIYCDVTQPVRRVGDGFEYDDLYLDVWYVPGREPVVLDEDELAEAVKSGYVSDADAEQAHRIAERLADMIRTGHQELQF